MNASLINLEIWVIALGLVLMLADFWMPAERKRFLGYAAAAALAVLLVLNLGHCATGTAFNGMFVQDGLACFSSAFSSSPPFSCCSCRWNFPTASRRAFQSIIH
jgi:NADH:ubiquinone oxidoreductase subunit 2 (subunit N)